MLLLPGGTAREGFPAYVASKLLAFEIDEVARLVSAFTRLLERVTERDDVEHAPAVGDELPVGVALGARVEHHYAVDILGLFYPEDDLALLVSPSGYPSLAKTTHTAQDSDHARFISSARPLATASMTSTRSLSKRGKTTCVLGSPKRALNCTTFGPAGVSMKPP